MTDLTETLNSFIEDGKEYRVARVSIPIECLEAWRDKFKQVQDDANILQCLKEAGIDNVEAYSIGMNIYYERYPEKDEFA